MSLSVFVCVYVCEEKWLGVNKCGVIVLSDKKSNQKKKEPKLYLGVINTCAEREMGVKLYELGF